MASNSSAVLDIVTESKDLSSILKENKDCSSISSANLENSIALSPSLESFSTIQDIENLSELNMDENSDLSVRIDSPQKHLETLETYISFRITTKVARIEFSENEYVVRRRYNDFIWLRQKLVECHPFCIVPPLPGKHTLIGQLDRYSKDFILLRMKSLNVFISRVVNHPILSCNEHFKVFLTAKPIDFSAHRKQRSSISLSDNKVRTLSHSCSTQTALKNRHMEFDKMKTYLNVLTEKLASIEKISSRINKERIEFSSELAGYHPVFTIWSNSEPELSNILLEIGTAVEKTMSAQQILVQNYPTTIANPIRDFLMYIEAVQETLKKREVHQCAYESSLDELNRRHGEKDRLVATTQNGTQQSAGFSLWKQPSSDEKLEKLGTYIPQLLKKVEANQDSLECANESLRSDLEYWQVEKQQCLKKILLDLVDRQIEYYQASVNGWEQANEHINTHSQNNK